MTATDAGINSASSHLTTSTKTAGIIHHMVRGGRPKTLTSIRENSLS